MSIINKIYWISFPEISIMQAYNVHSYLKKLPFLCFLLLSLLTPPELSAKNSLLAKDNKNRKVTRSGHKIKALFSPHQGQEAFGKLYEYISKANDFAHITVYSWSDEDLDEAIKKALLKEHKPQIKVVLSPHLWRAKKEKLFPRILKLELMGAEFKVAVKDMHEKFTLVDDIKLINTSANFSWGARTRYSENFIFHERKNKRTPFLQDIFSQFTKEFQILWNTGKDIFTHDEDLSEEILMDPLPLKKRPAKVKLFSSSMNFHLKKSLPSSKRALQGKYYYLKRKKDKNKNPTWTVKNQLLHLIKNAKKSIYLSLNHLAIAEVSDALIEAIKKGIEVKFVVDNQEFRRKAKKSALMAKFVKDWKSLKGNKNKIPPVQVKYYSISPSPYYWLLNHHKFILIDYHQKGIGTKLFSGSYNISKKAELYQFDNMVLYSNRGHRSLYTSFYREFMRLWNLNRPLDDEGKSKRLLSDEDLFPLLEGHRGELILHFQKPISLNWKETQRLRRHFVKQIDREFWTNHEKIKKCRSYFPVEQKFSHCK